MMLNVEIKNRLIQILNSLLQAHKECASNPNKDTLFVIMQDCQNAAVNVGETLEEYTDNSNTIVNLLEDYCEEIYSIAKNMIVDSEKIISLNKLINKVIDFIYTQECKYKLVFFPYKASMWDSLESIWMACSKDERCECQVVPIPYYKLDMQNGSAEFCYEITDFPKYVPVKNYQNYNIAREQPDIAYIHNPYDNCNYVTSIHPDYYSKRLKESVKKLVYVPYYITSGAVSEHHKYLPVYTQMDYMIAQSEEFKQGFKGLPYYNKILVFGSPKFDKIIQKSFDPDYIPDMWKSILKGKKSVMLNTSINCFLSNGELMLKKLKQVFCEFEKHKNIVLIWRPHPLIEATISSMRPELKDSYNELLEYFKQKKVGIYDSTPDITNTVAVSDAYIGENSSSVVQLFEVAGKPVFILDNYITEQFSEEEKRRILIADIVETENSDCLIPMQYNGIFCMKNNDWKNIKFIDRISGQPNWVCTYIMGLTYGGKIYLSPYDATDIISIDIPDNKFEVLNQNNNKFITSRALVEYMDCLFFILNYQDAIVQYNLRTRKWIIHNHIFGDLSEVSNEKKVSNMWSYTVCDELLLITAIHSNKILQFNMKNAKKNVIQISEEMVTFSGITNDDSYIYIAESFTGNIIYINRLNGEKGIYEMPDGFFVHERMGATSVAHLKLISTEKYIITIPYNGNGMVKIDKRTGNSKFIIKNFWDSSTNMQNGYSPYIFGKASFAKQTDSKDILVQRLYDGALAVLDVETEQYTVEFPVMSPKSYQRFMNGQDGFEKTVEGSCFACRENKFFSLDIFLDKLSDHNFENIQKRQRDALSSTAVNLDGTCGEKVHKQMMDILKQEIYNY